jgi:hypothetical protein
MLVGAPMQLAGATVDGLVGATNVLGPGTYPFTESQALKAVPTVEIVPVTTV